MPEKEVIQEAAKNHGLIVQWFIDFYGWAVVIIGGLLGYIWNSFSGRVTALEKDMGKVRSKTACKELMDKVEIDCEKDTSILREDMRLLNEGIQGVHLRLDKLYEAKGNQKGSG